jgi:hypothetical protein
MSATPTTPPPTTPSVGGLLAPVAPERKLTLPQKVNMSALVNKLLRQRDLQPYALGWGTRGLSLSHPLRRFAVAVANHSLFETFSLLVILANCVFLAIYDPLDFDDTGPRNRAIAQSEDVFQALFTVELLIKWVAFGLWGRGPSGKRVGYLTDAWNYLDGGIVMIGFLGYIPGLGSNASVLRTFRVLRPLRSMAAVPSMRVVVSSMLTALPPLGNVVLLALFSLLVFAIIGVQLWAGLLRGKCAYADPLDPSGPLVVTGIACGLPCDQQEGFECTPSGGDVCGPLLVRFEDPTHGTVNISTFPTTCVAGVSLPDYHGLYSFDNTGSAILTIFVGITLEGWTDTMYATQAAWGTKWLVALYWIVVVAFGAFFLLQLALAVIWESYQSSQSSEEDKADVLLVEHAGLLVEHLRAKKRAGACYGLCGPCSRACRARARRARQKSPRVAHHDEGADGGGGGGGGGNSAEAGVGAEEADPDAEEERRAAAAEAAEEAALATADKGTATIIRMRQIVSLLPTPKPKKVHPPIWPALSAFTSTSRFSFVMTSIICLNTIQLAMPYADMSDAYVHGLDVANYIFSGIFGVEMILKLAGDGPKRYLSEAFNVFDGAVVLLSFVDIALTVALGDAAGGLSALRTFRLARVFKLARSWKDLRRLLATIVKSLVNVSSAVGVLGIVLFIFTLLCMQLYGGKYQDAVDAGILEEIPRYNYDDLWTAFVSTFQTTTGENWNSQLADGAAAFGGSFIVVLIALELIGNYIFLNLFLAILLGAFENAMDDEAPAAAPAAAGKAGAPAAGPGSTTTTTPAPSSLPPPPPPLGAIADEEPLGGPPPKLFTMADLRPKADDDSEGGGASASSSSASVPQLPPADSGSMESSDGLSRFGGSTSDPPASSTTSVAESPSFRTYPAPAIARAVFTVEERADATSTATATPSASASASPTPDGVDGGATDTPRTAAAQRAKHVKFSEEVVVVPPVTAGGHHAAAAPGAAAAATTAAPSAPGSASTVKRVRRASVDDLVNSETGDRNGGATANLQMEMQKGATKSVVTVLKDESGNQRVVRVLASGDVQVASGDEEEGKDAGSVWDSAVAYKKLGVDPTPEAAVLAAAAAKQGKELRHTGVAGGYSWRQLSLNSFSPAHPLRKAAAVLVAHPWFEQLILALILISSVNLALDEPRVAECKLLPSNNPENCIALALWLKWSDIVITALFVLEMTAKIVALGFTNPKSAYLRNSWNVLDFVIVLISILSLALADLASKLRALRSMRALRALRPLRVVSRYPGLKLVVNAVIGAIPKALTVIVVNFLFLLILAIVGLQNFSGALSYCNDPEVAERADCTGTWTLVGDDCAMLPHATLEQACRESVTGADFPRVWQPVMRHFDDIFHAILTVFEVATGEAWPDIAYPVMDSVGPDKPMVRNANPLAALYFIIIQVACGFFMLELFTGVIIANYYQLKEQAQGSGLLTEQQQLWVEQMKMMLSVKAQKHMRRPEDSVAHPVLRRIRLRAFNVAVSRPFEWTIMAVILLNTIVLALRHYGENESWVNLEENLNDVFAGIFIAEATLKLVAFGPKQYFSVPWNRFDFTLVCASFIGWAAAIGPVATLLRIFRVARIIRLVRTSRGILLLFRTLIVSLPALANVGIILVLLLFIFAIIGMNLFAGVRRNDNLNEVANFDSFFTAMLTLFRCSTGENFNSILHNLEIQPPYCLALDADDGSGLLANCGDTVAPAMYFSLFSTLSTLVLIKLLVAVVLDNFSDMLDADKESDTFKLTPDVVEAYTEAWGVCDPDATKFLDGNGLVKLVQMLEYPLGVAGDPDLDDKSSTMKAAMALLSLLHLPPAADGKYQFHAVLQELAKIASGGGAVPPTQLQVTGDLRTGQYTLQDTLAAMRIQAVVRSRVARKRVFALVKERKRLKEIAEEEAKARAEGRLPPEEAAGLGGEGAAGAAGAAGAGTGIGSAAGAAGGAGGKQPLNRGASLLGVFRRAGTSGAAPLPVASPSRRHLPQTAAAGRGAHHAPAALAADAAAEEALLPAPKTAYRWGRRDRERKEKDKALYG